MSNPTVKVKPLVWRENSEKICIAKILCDAEDSSKNMAYFIDGRENTTLLISRLEGYSSLVKYLGEFPTLESAQSACQEHFDRFIMGWVEVAE